MPDLALLFEKPFDALLTSLSILTATGGWLFAAWQQRQLSMRSQTLTILLAQDTTTDLGRALDEAEILARAPVSRAEDIAREIRRALNYYEFMCSGVRAKTLDPHLIKRTMRFRLLRMYHVSLPILAVARRDRGNPKICEDLEWFVLRKLHYDQWATSVDAQGDPIMRSDRPASESAAADRAQPI